MIEDVSSGAAVSQNAKLKRKILVLAGVAVAVFTLAYVSLNESGSQRSEPFKQLVAARGAPTFLATSLEIEQLRVKVLRIQIPNLDPLMVTNWETVTNVIAIWSESEPAQRHARYFYDEWKNERSFDGDKFYASRPLFGEKLTTATIDSNGIAHGLSKIRVGAFSIQAVGFTRAHTNSSRSQ
jgi:hypothetical protein